MKTRVASISSRLTVLVVAAMVLAMAMVVGAVGCGSTAPPPTTAKPPAAPAPTAAPAPAQSQPAAKAPTVVKLWGVQPLSGANSAPGSGVQAGAELAVKQINAAGGFKDDAGNSYTLEISRNDMRDDRNEAIALFRQAASDPKVLLEIGPCSSVGFVPVVPVAAELKMPLIGNGSYAQIKDWSKYAYRVNMVSPTVAPTVLKVLKKKLGFNRLSLIADQTNDGQVALAQVVRSSASSLGYQVVSDAVFRPTDQDFSAQASQIKAANPEFIFIGSAATTGGKVAAQIKNAGVTAPQLGPDGGALDNVWWDNSDGAGKGSYSFIGPDVAHAKGGLKGFLDDFVKANPNLSPSVYPIYGYDSVQVAVAAIKKAGAADREKVAQALSAMDITTSIGSRVAFKNPPNGDNVTPVVTVIQITNRGTYEVIEQ